MNIIQCTKCLIPLNHPFGDTSSRSICRACRMDDPHSPFDDLIARVRSGKRGVYDCIVPITGIAEDFYVLRRLADHNLKPLCVFVNSLLATDIAWKNVHRLIHMYDVELRTYTPNPFIYRKLIKNSLRKYQDILIPYKMLKFAYPMKIAKSLNIKFILSGEFQPQLTTGKFKKMDSVENSLWSHFEHDLGCDYDSFFNSSLEVSEAAELPYKFDPYYHENEVHWEYLSNYQVWDQWKQDHEMNLLGALAQNDPYSFDVNHRAGSSVFYQINDLLRYKKFGYFKVLEHLAREVRAGRINVENAHDLYLEYEKHNTQHQLVTSNISNFFGWLKIDQSGIDWFLQHYILNRSLVHSQCCSPVDYKGYFDRLIHVESTNYSKTYCTYEKGIL